MALCLLLPLFPLPGRPLAMIGLCGGNRALWGFSTVLIPLLGPSWVTNLVDVVLGGGRGRREPWL